MKFSIVIPVYKVEKYLRECLDSVLNQTFTDFEIILVDDGSPDTCPLICDEYVGMDCRITVIHQKNAGIACARNAGIAAAKGEYVICIDSDDYLIGTNVLTEIAKKTEANPDVIMFGYKKFFESDGSWGNPIFPSLTPDLTTPDALKEMLLNGSYIATAWTKAVRLDILKRNNITFRSGMVSGEDVDWYLNLLCYVEKMECINIACIAYRQRPDSISHSPKMQSLTDFLWILEEWPKKFEERVLSTSMREVFNNLMAYYWANVFVLYSTYKKTSTVQYRGRLKKLCYLKDYAITARALTIKKFYVVVGFDMTIILLKFLGNFKKRQ